MSADLPTIWRVHAKTPGFLTGTPGVTRHDEVIYDETPGYVGCTVRSWLTDGYVVWGWASRRYFKTDACGGWEAA